MKKSYAALASGITASLLALLTVSALAQAPTLSGSTPGRNVVAAPRTGAVAFTFSQAVTGAGGIHIFSNQWRGYRTGAAGGDGTATLRVQPTQVFAPGEEVSVTVPATVRGATPGGAPLAAGQVLQFRAAGGPALGTFQLGPAVTGYGDFYFQYPHLVDIDGDGRLDLVYIDPTMNTIYKRLGDGLGNFGVRQAIRVTNVNELCMTDVNNDGKPDMIMNAPFGGSFAIEISLGDGQGSFTRAPSSPLAVGPITLCVRAADVNADGNLDLMYVTDRYVAVGGTPAATTLDVFLGNGRGGFAAQPAIPLDLGWGGLRVADANNDGLLDCLVANSATGQLKTFLGNGQGSFALANATPLTIPVLTTPNSSPGLDLNLPVAADFTGDGNVDVLVLDPAANAIRLHPGTGQGGFGAATVLTTPYLRRVQAADLDGDGDLDLVTNSGGSNNTTPISYWRNNGSGTFTAQPALAGPATQLVTGDINNDGTLDVLGLSEANAGGTGGVYSFLNQPVAGAPTLTGFAPATPVAGSTVSLTGTNLGTATAVLIGGVLLTGFTVNPTTGVITFVMPANSMGGLITVITPTGTATSRLALRGTLAVRAAASSLPVQLYPNPASGTVLLLLPADAPAGPLQATFYNSLGQLVRTATAAVAPGYGTELALTGLAPGLYTLRLQLGSRLAVRQLMVE